ncbi:MAG: hypothetical protein J7605_06025 [Variovorax sp.]|nr:hypothetical protein [Variovorax sp.]
MSGFNPRLELLLRDVGGPSSAASQNLRTVIEESPALLQQMNSAIVHGHLKRFAWMPEQENAGASFNAATQTINLKQSDVSDPGKRDTLTFILGHEVQHALNRVDEAIAHIAGWNALASRLNHENPEAKLRDFGRRLMLIDYAGDFVQLDEVAERMEFVAKTGFTFNADLSITPDARNIEAAGRHYFDKISDDARLGHHGDSDYTNYYAAGLVGTVCQYEMLNPRLAGQLQLDMDGLKLEERLLEQNGISLGSADARCAYYDTRSPMIENYFDHTADRHAHIPIHGLPQPSRLAHDLSQDAAAAELTDADHPGHMLFKQAQAGVHQLDAKVGRTPDHRSDQLAAALAAAATVQGMDHRPCRPEHRCIEGVCSARRFELTVQADRQRADSRVARHVHFAKHPGLGARIRTEPRTDPAAARAANGSTPRARDAALSDFPQCCGRYIVASTSTSTSSPGRKRDTSTTVLTGGSPG